MHVSDSLLLTEMWSRVQLDIVKRLRAVVPHESNIWTKQHITKKNLMAVVLTVALFLVINVLLRKDTHTLPFTIPTKADVIRQSFVAGYRVVPTQD